MTVAENIAEKVLTVVVPEGGENHGAEFARKDFADDLKALSLVPEDWSPNFFSRLTMGSITHADVVGLDRTKVIWTPDVKDITYEFLEVEDGTCGENDTVYPAKLYSFRRVVKVEEPAEPQS
jgi:hypothetical protein